jgi:Prokaryotic phospholipase A2
MLRAPRSVPVWVPWTGEGVNTMRRNVIRFLVLTTIAASLAVLAPTAASAHGWYDVPNGCSGPTRETNWMVPDSGWDHGEYFDFHASCDTHDLCYVYAWYQRTDKGREACDVQFYNNMARWCQTKYPWTYWWTRCTARAEVYYRGVQVFGKPYFYKPDAISRADTRIA